MSKIPKKAQVAFNQFIFDTMMEKTREVELLVKRIVALENYPKTGEEARRYWVVPDQRFVHVEQRIAAIEKEIKDQREDYHAHIRQLVEENEAAHKNLISEYIGLTNAVLKLQRARDTKGRFKSVDHPEYKRPPFKK